MNILLILALAVAVPSLQEYRKTEKPNVEVATMCFSKGEQVSGMNKICYYDCLGSLTAITIKSYELCPLTINQ